MWEMGFSETRLASGTVVGQEKEQLTGRGLDFNWFELNNSK